MRTFGVQKTVKTGHLVELTVSAQDPGGPAYDPGGCYDVYTDGGGWRRQPLALTTEGAPSSTALFWRKLRGKMPLKPAATAHLENVHFIYKSPTANYK